MNRHPTRSAALGAGLLLAVTWTFAGSKSYDQVAHSRRAVALRTLQQLDSTQDQHLLGARLLMTGSYDPLVDDERHIELTLADPVLVSADALEPAIPVLRQRIAKAFADKAQAIEDFKSSHAILRNSMDYLPLVADELAQVIDRTPNLESLQQPLRHVLVRVLAQSQSETEAEDRDLDQAIAGLAARRPRIALPALDQVLAHARAVLANVRETNTLMAAILAAPTGALLAELADACDGAERQLRTSADFHRLALYALSLALFAWGISAWRRLRQANADLERRIRERTAELRAILASAADGIVGFDAQARATFANPGAERLLGRTGERLLGATLDELCGAEAAASLRRFDRGVVPCQMARPDGSAVACELTCAANGQQDGPTGLFVVSIRDVTQRQQLQEQLAAAQKLEAIGQLAAGIAHEINTPTQYIGDNVRFLRDSFGDIHRLIAATSALADETSGPAAAAVRALRQGVDFAFLSQECPLAIDQSLDGVERVARIVSSMKDFAHPDRSDKEAVDLNRVITSTTTVCRTEWKHVADLQLDLDPDLPAIDGYTGDLGQVVLNLVVNAAHAIADVTRGTHDKGRIVVRSRRDGDAVLVQVADTGSGIPDHVKPHIFEQFFTTKRMGKGTGQGLAHVHRVVTARHGGRVWFESTVGVGTTFTVRLPVADARLQPRREGAA